MKSIKNKYVKYILENVHISVVFDYTCFNIKVYIINISVLERCVILSINIDEKNTVLPNNHVIN